MIAALRADDATPVAPGSRIRIGPYELTMQGPEIAVFEQEAPTYQQERPSLGGTTPQMTPTQIATSEPAGAYFCQPTKLRSIRVSRYSLRWKW